MKKTRVLSVANSKGGVGKSTVTMLLASALAIEDKRKVLILDTDNQQTISDFHYNTEEAVVEVEAVAPRRVHSFLERFGNDFDIIFIDIPRITARVKDSPAVMLLYYCDSVLIPVVGSKMDVLSTIDFIPIMEDVKATRKESKHLFKYYGFINRRNTRKENEMAETVLQEKNLPLFDNSMADLKLYTTPSLSSTILGAAEGERRFRAFYNEFKTKYKL